MNDRLQQLALFVRVAETGSFSKAGRDFGLSQPSVSRTIAALEDRLGVKLLVRTTRQLSLTEAGEVLLARSREALESVTDAENAAQGADSLSGVLRIALPTTFGVRQIVPLLPGFLERHPGLAVDLMMSDRYENLVAEGADLALRLGPQADSSFVRRKLASSRRLFAASPGYLKRRGTPNALAELPRYDLIGGPGDFDEQKWIAHRDGATEAVAVSPRIRTRSASGVVASAAAGLGIAIVSTWMCDLEFASGALVEVLANYRLDPIEASIVFPGGRRPARKARAFADYLVDVFPRGQET